MAVVYQIMSIVPTSMKSWNATVQLYRGVSPNVLVKICAFILIGKSSGVLWTWITVRGFDCVPGFCSLLSQKHYLHVQSVRLKHLSSGMRL